MVAMPLSLGYLGLGRPLPVSMCEDRRYVTIQRLVAASMTLSTGYNIYFLFVYCCFRQVNL